MEDQDIVIEITIKQGNPDHLDVSHKILNMNTMQDAATVSNVLTKSGEMIIQLVKEHMPKEVKKMSKMKKSDHIAYMKTVKLPFMIDK